MKSRFTKVVTVLVMVAVALMAFSSLVLALAQEAAELKAAHKMMSDA